MNKIIIAVILIFESIYCYATETRVRRVFPSKDQIVRVNTALGIATIIQLPDRPNSVVVGDQEAFKVEYLDQALTIKPLQFGVKSNLYIYTDYKRFNVQLITGPEKEADYVVYLNNTPINKMKLTDQGNYETTPNGIHWKPLNKFITNDSLSLKIIRLGQAEDHRLLLIEILLTSGKQELLKPDWLWITQEGKTKSIHNLFLSGLEVNSKSSVLGLLQILRSDLNEKKPFHIQIRRKIQSSITLPKVASW